MQASKAAAEVDMRVWNGDFPIYAASWSMKGGCNRFAVGSCYNQEENFVRIIRDVESGSGHNQKDSTSGSSFEECCEPIFHSYPPSALLWGPEMLAKDILVSSGQLGITVYLLEENTTGSAATCNIEYKRDSEVSITNLDWNKSKTSEILACRTDAKCVLYDLNVGVEKTILSPKKGWQIPGFENNFVKIFDVKFCNSKRGLFATAHEDGSINLYDERSGKCSLMQLLEPIPTGATQEYFTYEKNEPVIKLAFGPDYLLAALKNNSNAPIVLDIRKPNFPITLECHENERYTSTIAAIKWCPNAFGNGGKVLATAGGKGNILLWDGSIRDPPKNKKCSEVVGIEQTRCNRPCVSEKCESHQVYDNFFNGRPVIKAVQPWDDHMQRAATNVLFAPNSKSNNIAATVDGDILVFNQPV